MSNLSPRQFGAQNAQPTQQKRATPPRTLGGDIIDARGRIGAANRTQGSNAETPPWLQRSYGG